VTDTSTTPKLVIMNTANKIHDSARILIVDDEPLIRKILIKYLGDKNYLIDTAEDGTGALEKLQDNIYDLVLTDLRMPKMGGRELLKIMAEKYPEIPKIILTGYGTNEDIIIALKNGAYDFLTKPITDFTILEHSIERAIEKKRLNDNNKKYIEQLTRINEIISMLNRGKNTEDIFNTLNNHLKRNISFNRFTLSNLDRDSGIVTIKLVESDRNILLRQGDTFNLKDSSLQKVCSDQIALNIPDLSNYLENNPESLSTRLLLEEGMQSTLVLPLIVNNDTRGFLLFSSVEKNAFTPDHITFLDSIVGQIALSVQRGELLYEIEQHSKNLEHLIELRSRQIIKTQKTTIFALSRLAEARDTETGDHIERMRSYSVFLAQLFKYTGNHPEITNQYLRDLYDSSILHDIGKVGIPDGILLKEGYLSDAEFEIMKNHTNIGFQALQAASQDLGADSFLNMAMDITLYHHERWDGKGYPEGLFKENIPLSARIVAIADVYDALTSKRPYKEAYPHNKAIETMKEETGKFDPILIKIFLDHQEEFNKIRLQVTSEEILEI